jgi:hypothetical protein
MKIAVTFEVDAVDEEEGRDLVAVFIRPSAQSYIREIEVVEEPRGHDA